MKRNALFAILFTLVIGVLFIACPNSTDPEPDAPIDIAGTEWSDGLKPETTLSFLANNTVRLGGEVSPAANNKNWYWGNLPSTTLPFDLVEGADAVRDLVDQVEDNWGTNITLPDAVIVVWTNAANKIGFQLHYYKAVASGKNYERLVCWGLSSPHEFKKKE
jgi:hypothetical protein